MRFRVKDVLDGIDWIQQGIEYGVSSEECCVLVV